MQAALLSYFHKKIPLALDNIIGTGFYRELLLMETPAKRDLTKLYYNMIYNASLIKTILSGGKILLTLSFYDFQHERKNEHTGFESFCFST